MARRKKAGNVGDVVIHKWHSKELRLKAKRANQRMVRLEKGGMKSPAYLRIQGLMEQAGIKKKSAKGRRFPESGEYTDYNDLKKQLALIDRFLNMKTSTKKGYEEWRQNIYDSANQDGQLEAHGIDKETYLSIFEELPDDEEDRVFYASYYVEMVEAYQYKVSTGKIKRENAYTVAELIDKAQSSVNYKEALNKIGISLTDVKKVKRLIQ